MPMASPAFKRRREFLIAPTAISCRLTGKALRPSINNLDQGFSKSSILAIKWISRGTGPAKKGGSQVEMWLLAITNPPSFGIFSDPKAFIFSAKDPENVLRGASEVSLRSIMGRTTLDNALTSRTLVEQDTYAFLLKLLDNYNVGIGITEIKLQVVDPPEEVKDAFQDVTRALEEETTLQNSAKQYAANRIPLAKGQVQVKIREAAAFHQRQIENATGDTARFIALLEEYRKDPIVTRDRIYLEKMETVFAGVNKTIIDTKVQVLPLLDFAKSSDISLNDSREATNE